MKEDPSAASRPQDDLQFLRNIAAAPRPTGSVAIAGARERCVRELRDLGFQIRERPFEYSSFPGRYATPMFGALGLVLGAGVGMRAQAGERVAAFSLALAGVAVLWAVGRWLTRSGVLTAPLLRRQGVNLEATRGTTPSVWLCAHLDSKSQPIPTLVRSIGLVLEGAGVALALLFALVAVLGANVPPGFWLIAGLVTLAGALPVVTSMVGPRSPGALDNASGVATVMAAARLLADEPNVGVLITDAEELGLAGARAWARGAARTVVLNCDGVDDVGSLHIMHSGRRSEPIIRAAQAATQTLGTTLGVGMLFPGVLTDSVAFTDAGLTSATFSRGSMMSLWRVHSMRDDLAHLSGSGIAGMAALLAATARGMKQ